MNLTKPTCEDMLTAADWLDVNGSQSKENEENEIEEMTSCTKVAKWLRVLVEKADKKRLDEIAINEFMVRIGTCTCKYHSGTNCPGPTTSKICFATDPCDSLAYFNCHFKHRSLLS